MLARAHAHKITRTVLLCVGVLVILVGASDMVTRLAHNVFPENAASVAFGPAITTLAQPLVPARLDIPAIGVHATVEQVVVKADGSMGTPHNFTDVGWYSLGVKPGEPGNAVIDGHVNNALTTAGVFEHLGDLKAGDYVTVSDTGGHALVYKVGQVERYGADSAPLSDIFATAGPSQLVLITCDGDWVQAKHSFDKRLVVYASLATR